MLGTEHARDTAPATAAAVTCQLGLYRVQDLRYERVTASLQVTTQTLLQVTV